MRNDVNTRPDDAGANPAVQTLPENIQRQVSLVRADSAVAALMATVSGYLMILNEQRQMVGVNATFLDDFRVQDADALIGCLPGELLACVNEPNAPGGCGTSENCSFCGAFNAIIAAMKLDQPFQWDCLMTSQVERSFQATEFRVRAVPLWIAGERFVAVVMHDVSDTRRRRLLESALSKASVFGEPRGETASRIAMDLRDLTILLRAENGSLSVVKREVRAADLLCDLLWYFEGQAVMAGKKIETAPSLVSGLSFETEPILLLRSLIHAVSNALEASPSGGIVRIDVAASEQDIVFSIWNDAMIPRPVALRIFQRSFSTRGAVDRGVGTYTMKLFVESYLGGRVAFTSEAGKGTTFTIRLPA